MVRLLSPMTAAIGSWCASTPPERSRPNGARVAKQRPAVLVVFDLLRLVTADLTELPLARRRARLEDLLGPGHNCLQLVSHTADPELAEDWLSLAPGLEGVVAKRRTTATGQGVAIGSRSSATTPVDCAVVGIAGELATPS